MINYTFPIDYPVTYHWCGKFKTPTSEWIHMTRKLSEYELFLVTEGILYIADSENKYAVKKDEYLFMSPTEKQYGYAASNCSFFWFHFTPYATGTDTDSCGSTDSNGSIDSYRCTENNGSIDNNRSTDSFSSTDRKGTVENNVITVPQQTMIPNIERIIILINQLQDADRRYHHKVTMDMLATGLLLELYNQIQTQQSGNTLSSRKQLHQAILDYITWNKFNRISVLELSEYFGYHEKYLSSVFKSIAGIPLKQYILQETMEHAKAELMDTNKTIAQIGYSIGYTDSHNFSHAFKKVVGITPKEYRISCIKLPRTP